MRKKSTQDSTRGSKGASRPTARAAGKLTGGKRSAHAPAQQVPGKGPGKPSVIAGRAVAGAGKLDRAPGRMKVTLPVRGAGSAARAARRPGLEKARVRATASAESPRSRLDHARRAAALAGAQLAIDAALDRKALLPVLLDVGAQVSYTDYIGIVSGRSDRQVLAIAEHVEQHLKERGWTLIGREGQAGGRWSLLDFGDFVLHVFYHPVREVYDIEGLWIEATRVELRGVPPEALHFQADALYALP